jgi:hypothetical protein
MTSTDQQSRQYFRNQIVQRAFSRSSLGELILKNGLYATDRQRMTLDAVIERMRHDIVITLTDSPAADPKHFAFVVRYVCPDPAQAQSTADALVAKMIEANLAEAIDPARLAETGTERRHAGTTLQLVHPPSLPQRPVGLNRLLITTLGIGTGVVLAVLATVAMRLRGPATQT